MPREPEPSVNEQAFVLEALLQDTRIDGRRFDEFRNIQLSFGDDYGIAHVNLGKTRVIAQISAETTKPLPDRPFDGVFTITTELSPIASPAFEVGRQTEQEMVLSRILEKAIRRSNALDTESLCIVAGELCWSVRADVHVVDYDGGLTDASCIAVIAALQHFRRPEVSIEGQNVRIYTLAERVPVPLSILHQPICVTFSFFHGGEAVLIDATLQEEQLREAEMIVTMNRHGEVCQIAKLGGAPIEALTLLQCTGVALKEAQKITKLITVKLEADLKEKDVGAALLVAENDR